MLCVCVLWYVILGYINKIGLDWFVQNFQTITVGLCVDIVKKHTHYTHITEMHKDTQMQVSWKSG